MNSLIAIIQKHKNSPIKEVIDSKMQEFENLGLKDSKDLFKELCFCLMTANFSAQGGIKIQNAIGNDFLNLKEEELTKKLREFGHRFPNTRAKYISEAQKHKDELKNILDSFKTEKETREWIVKNIKGIGMKEASHFLRNIGYKNLAIIDFHIIDLLSRSNVIEPQISKSITPKRYVEIENILNELAKKTNTNLGELDLYLWFEETGKILK